MYHQYDYDLTDHSGLYMVFLAPIFHLFVNVTKLIQELIIGPSELQAVQAVPRCRGYLYARLRLNGFFFHF